MGFKGGSRVGRGGGQGGGFWRGRGCPLPNEEGSHNFFCIFVPKWRIFVHSANDEGGSPLDQPLVGFKILV